VAKAADRDKFRMVAPGKPDIRIVAKVILLSFSARIDCDLLGGGYRLAHHLRMTKTTASFNSNFSSNLNRRIVDNSILKGRRFGCS
ncbi:hypothetical protein, partial [Bacteroides ovatus]|uniref:hypothetical protein n=1 Tax=Bacteroides ovatus TaxID=28116 RepID=UPI001E36BBB6